MHRFTSAVASSMILSSLALLRDAANFMELAGKAYACCQHACQILQVLCSNRYEMRAEQRRSIGIWSNNNIAVQCYHKGRGSNYALCECLPGTLTLQGQLNDVAGAAQHEKLPGLIGGCGTFNSYKNSWKQGQLVNSVGHTSLHTSRVVCLHKGPADSCLICQRCHS